MAKQDRKDRDFVLDMFEATSRHGDMGRMREEWDQSDKLVEGWRPAKDANRSNFFIPRTYSTIRAELATIMESMFAQEQDPPFIFRPPETLSDDVPLTEVSIQADLDTAFVANQLRALNGFLLLRNWVDCCLRYGTGILKVGWRRLVDTDFDEQPVLDPVTQMPIMGMDGQPLTRPVPVERVRRNTPTLSNVDIRNFFVDMNYDNLEDMDFVIQRKQVSRQYVEAMAKATIYNGEEARKVLEDKSDAAKEEMEEFAKVLASWRGLSADSPVKVDPDSPEFKRFAKVTLLELQTDDTYYTVASSPGKGLLRKTDNPFEHGKKSYLAIRNIVRPKLFYGKSEPMLIKSLQEQENIINNIATDTVVMALHKMFAVDRNADVDIDRLRSRQGNIILTDGDPRATVTQLDVNEVGLNGFQIMQNSINSAYEDATSISRQFKGATPSRGETATTTAALLNQASAAIKFKWREFMHEGLLPLAKMMQSMNRQFITEEQVVKITNEVGQQVFQIYKADKFKDMEFPVYPASSVDDVYGNQQLRVNNILRAIQLTGQNPVYAQYIKPYGQLLELFKALKFRDPQNLIFSPQEVEQAQQMQQQTGQVPGGVPNLQVLQGGGGQGPGQDFGAGQRPQNAPSPESAEDLVQSESTFGTQAPT